jgi:hypothetical protein
MGQLYRDKAMELVMEIYRLTQAWRLHYLNKSDAGGLMEPFSEVGRILNGMA